MHNIAACSRSSQKKEKKQTEENKVQTVITAPPTTIAKPQKSQRMKRRENEYHRASTRAFSFTHRRAIANKQHLWDSLPIYFTFSTINCRFARRFSSSWCVCAFYMLPFSLVYAPSFFFAGLKEIPIIHNIAGSEHIRAYTWTYRIDALKIPMSSYANILHVRCDVSWVDCMCIKKTWVCLTYTCCRLSMLW